MRLNIRLTAFYRTKTPVDRGIKQSGVMTKDGGQQSSYGVPYEILPTINLSKSENPTKKTQKRIQDESQLRMDIKKFTPGLFCITYSSTLWHLLTYSSHSIHQLCRSARFSPLIF